MPDHGLEKASAYSVFVGALSKKPAVPACTKKRLGSVGPGMEENQRSQTTNSCARAVVTGTWSGVKHRMAPSGSSGWDLAKTETNPELLIGGYGWPLTYTAPSPQSCSRTPENPCGGSISARSGAPRC